MEHFKSKFDSLESLFNEFSPKYRDKFSGDLTSKLMQISQDRFEKEGLVHNDSDDSGKGKLNPILMDQVSEQDPDDEKEPKKTEIEIIQEEPGEPKKTDMELLETAKTAKKMGNSEFKKKEMHRAQELY